MVENYTVMAFCLAALLNGCALPSHRAPERVIAGIIPDPNVQSRLKVVCSERSWPEIVRQSAGVVELLGKPPGGDPTGERKLILQLIYFVARERPDETTKTVVPWLLDQLRISSGTLAQNLRPYLHSQDDQVRHAAELLALRRASQLNVLDTSLPDFETNFLLPPEGVAPLAGNPLADPPTDLTRHLFMLHPDAALREMISVYLSAESDPAARTRLLRSEAAITQHTGLLARGIVRIDDAIEPAVTDALRDCANSEIWWVRLYVAAVMHQHHELANAEHIKALLYDSHPMVRELASEIGATARQTGPIRGSR